MKDKRELSAIGQLLLIIGLMLGGLLLSFLLSFIGLLPFGGLHDILETLTHPSDHIAHLKFMQIIQAICLFIIPAFLFAKLMHIQAFSFLHLDKNIKSRTAIIVILVIIAAVPFINMLGFFNTKMTLPEFMSPLEDWMKEAEERAATLTALIVSGHNIWQLAINLIMIAVLPAIGEEMIFRGVLQPILLKATRNKHTAIIIAAIIFSAFHLQFYGFLPRLFLGIVLGYLYFASGSLWLSILAHFTNNALATIVYYLNNNGIMTENIDTIGTGDSWTIGLLSGGILLIIYFYLERNKTELQLNELK